MAIRVALNHITHYQYDRPVTMSPHVVRLRPAPHARTPICAYSSRCVKGPGSKSPMLKEHECLAPTELRFARVPQVA